MVNFSEIWDKSGKQYHDYALKYPQYMKTNEALIKLAEIKPSQVIVDLACGTGLTTKEILKSCPDIKKIYAVDFSKDMIDIAKEFIQSKKVTFIITDVLEIDRFISEKVDVVLCNSAFWQFQNENKVIGIIYKLLKDDGTLVFNIGQQFFDFEKPELNAKLIMTTVFSEMKKRGFKLSPSGKIKPKFDKEKIEELFRIAGFRLEKIESVNIRLRTLEDFLSFLKIPATATFFEDVPKKEQEQILNSTYEKLKNQIKGIENNKWIYFVFKKILSRNR